MVGALNRIRIKRLWSQPSPFRQLRFSGIYPRGVPVRAGIAGGGVNLPHDLVADTGIEPIKVVIIVILQTVTSAQVGKNNRVHPSIGFQASLESELGRILDF